MNIPLKNNWVRNLLVIVGLLFITLICYWPGLNSPFMLDDFHNLEPLANRNHTDNLSHYLQFIFSGTAGPLGRPIGLASFLLNDTTWPSHPWWFKTTNLIIHFINGLLIYWLAYKLFGIKQLTKINKQWLASLCALVWLCHPMQTSTVLYVIQRMTELSTLFTLIGVIGYFYGRELIAKKQLQAYVLMTSSVLGAGLLAVLSKENGVLILLYVLLVEFVVIKPTQAASPKYLTLWLRCVIIFPIVVFALYLVSHWEKFSATYEHRSFSFLERVLTQPRILSEYIYNFIYPKMSGVNLFNDDYIVSTSLISPLTTLLSLVFIGAILALAVKYRKRYPLACFGVLWFLIGHLLESTVLPLELYFEHRNYLPLFGLVIAIASVLPDIKHEAVRRLAPVGIAVIVLLSLASTFYNAKVWSQPLKATQLAIATHPNSIRATQAVAAEYFVLGDYVQAEKYFTRGFESELNDSGLLLKLITSRCYRNEINAEQIKKITSQLEFSKFSYAANSSIVFLARYIINNRCESFAVTELIPIIDQLLKNPNFDRNNAKYVLHYWRGNLLVAQKEYRAALAEFDLAFKFNRVIHIPIEQATLLLNMGQAEQSMPYIDKSRKLDVSSNWFWQKNVHKARIDQLKAIAKNMTKQEKEPPAGNI